MHGYAHAVAAHTYKDDMQLFQVSLACKQDSYKGSGQDFESASRGSQINTAPGDSSTSSKRDCWRASRSCLSACLLSEALAVLAVPLRLGISSDD
jgi:hypothetical protein